MKKLIQKFRELDKEIRQLIQLLIIVLLLFLGTVMLKKLNSSENFNIDYKELESGVSLASSGVLVNDRGLYWELKSIINKFLYTKQDENPLESDNNKSDVELIDYYETLTKKYKKHLDEDAYMDKANKFVNKFLAEDHLGYKYVDDFIIEKIFRYNDDMFLCLVKSEISLQTGYIGIQLNEDKLEFSIFYIE